MEMMNLPLSSIASLYKLAIEKNKKAEADEEERKRQEAEAIENEMEDLE